MEKLIRLLKILYAIQAKPGISAKELAERCETTDRTIYRDLEVLDSVAPNVRGEYGKGYRFDGNFAVYPLNFTEEEALVFSVLPSVVDKTQLPPGFESAYDKVIAAHRKDTGKRYETLENVADIIQMGSGLPRWGEHELPVADHGSYHRTANDPHRHHTQTRNEENAREIDPYYLVPRDQRFYLMGYCHRKQTVLTFRISRFRQVEKTSKRYERSNFSINQYMRHTWSIRRAETLTKFKVRFTPDVARYIKEEEMFVRPTLTDLPDGSLLFEATVNHEDEFLEWVRKYGPRAEILEPQSVRERFRQELSEWLGVYG